MITRYEPPEGTKTISIIGGQFGDEGKGKIDDKLVADWGNYNARGGGGANAGHTVYFNEEEHAFRLLPSGILHDHDHKINVIGPGVAFNPKVACAELSKLRESGFKVYNLKISHRAILVLPQHMLLDQIREMKRGAARIGTTLNGIGPAYEHHVGRIGLTVNDLVNGKNNFIRKLERNLNELHDVFAAVDSAYLKDALSGEKFESGKYYADEFAVFNLDAIAETYLGYGEWLDQYITDTDALMRSVVGSKNIVLEGAQATLLSVDFGTYPDVTSSDCTDQGLAKGCGLRERNIDLTLLVFKAPYMTRVGNGPFPTELGAERSAAWCADKDHTPAFELQQYPQVSLNDPDPFVQGIAIRRAGKESGTVTGRLRRVGWFDLPLARYAAECACPHTELVLTKLDVMDHCRTIKICDAYEYRGSDIRYGDRVYHFGDKISTAVPCDEILKYCYPLYSIFQGWEHPISHIRDMKDLPHQTRNYLGYIERGLRRKIRMLSVGPDREQTIIVP